MCGALEMSEEMAAEGTRAKAFLTWRPARFLDSDRENSFTSPPFKNPSLPCISWKLSVRGGSGSTTQCSTGKRLRGGCSECLEFSLELVGGGEEAAVELVPELSVTVEGRDSRDQSVSVAGSFRSFPCHLRAPAVNRRINSPVIGAAVSYEPALGNLTFTNERLILDPKYADFEIRVEEEKIPIHRAIFASFSEVFARMFERDMEEKAQGFVVVEDVSAEAMRGLRLFVYTGQAAAVREDLLTFLDLGEKYEIRELKAFCARELQQKLSVDNLCETAEVADKYGLEGLFEACLAKFKGPDGRLRVPRGHWDLLVKDHQDVAFRLLNGSVSFA